MDTLILSILQFSVNIVTDLLWSNVGYHAVKVVKTFDTFILQFQNSTSRKYLGFCIYCATNDKECCLSFTDNNGNRPWEVTKSTYAPWMRPV